MNKNISEMTKEEIRQFIDTLSKEEFTYALCIAKAYEKLEDYSQHQKRIIDRLSRKIQKLNSEKKKLQELKSGSFVISSDGMKFYIGDEEIKSILENQDVLNLNTNSINQKITFHGRTYIIRNLLLTQKIGCVDELHVIAHDISENLVKEAGESNANNRY